MLFFQKNLQAESMQDNYGSIDLGSMQMKMHNEQ